MDLIGYLTRFGGLRVISEQTSDLFGDHKTDVSRLQSDFGVQYAIIGHVQGNDAALKIDFQLVDTATQTNIWSDHLQRERTDPTVVADEASRGIARMLAIEIGHLGVLRERANPISQLTTGELVARGYSELQMGTIRENLSAAMMLFDEALRRNPHYQPAILAVARVHIIAAMNFVDLDVASDLNETERVLNEILDKSPNSISALYSMALLQKYHGHYAASLRSLQRCLELNPSFLPAQGQVGDVLIRMGQPQQGLEQILQTIRAATPNDPTAGYWYLFAAEAELELGHERVALDWALRADTFMPGSPLVKAWLASIYATIGDKSNAAKSVAALTKMAPGRTQLFMQRTTKDAGGADNRHWPRIFDGLRLALSLSPRLNRRRGDTAGRGPPVRMLAPINVDRHCRICACNCSGTYYFFRSSCRHSVVCRWRDRRPRRRSTKQRDKAMRLTPFARTSFSCSLCGALFAAQSPSMQRHRGVKGNFAFDHVLNTTKLL